VNPRSNLLPACFCVLLKEKKNPKDIFRIFYHFFNNFQKTNTKIFYMHAWGFITGLTHEKKIKNKIH
jgi:hypothetical protein